MSTLWHHPLVHPLVRTAGSLAWRWLPPFLLAAFLLGLGRTPDLRFVSAEEEDLLIRKLGHGAAYGLLAVLVYVALRPADDTPRSPWRTWLVPLLFTAVVAIADELLQSTAAGREAKVTDVLTDLTGALAVLLLLRSWRYQRAARDPRAETRPRRAPASG
jgi:VanZ family protein